MEIKDYVVIGVMVILGIVIGSIIDNLGEESTQTYGDFTHCGYVANLSTCTLDYNPVVADSQVLYRDNKLMVEGTNYTFADSTGVITLLAENNGTINGTYTYTKDLYLTNSLDRTVASYYGTMFMLGILIIAGYVFIKRSGLF